MSFKPQTKPQATPADLPKPKPSYQNSGLPRNHSNHQRDPLTPNFPPRDENSRKKQSNDLNKITNIRRHSDSQQQGAQLIVPGASYTQNNVGAKGNSGKTTPPQSHYSSNKPYTGSTNQYGGQSSNGSRVSTSSAHSAAPPPSHHSNQSSQSSTGKGGQTEINAALYKTELCRKIAEGVPCNYQDKCRFAHSLEELRSVNRHKKYKTEYCKNFTKNNYCPYGSRCNFIHEPLESASSGKSSDLTSQIMSNISSSNIAIGTTNANNNTNTNQHTPAISGGSPSHDAIPSIRISTTASLESGGAGGGNGSFNNSVFTSAAISSTSSSDHIDLYHDINMNHHHTPILSMSTAPNLNSHLTLLQLNPLDSLVIPSSNQPHHHQQQQQHQSQSQAQIHMMNSPHINPSHHPHHPNGIMTPGLTLGTLGIASPEQLSQSHHHQHFVSTHTPISPLPPPITPLPDAHETTLHTDLNTYGQLSSYTNAPSRVLFGDSISHSGSSDALVAPSGGGPGSVGGSTIGMKGNEVMMISSPPMLPMHSHLPFYQYSADNSPYLTGLNHHNPHGVPDQYAYHIDHNIHASVSKKQQQTPNEEDDSPQFHGARHPQSPTTKHHHDQSNGGDHSESSNDSVDDNDKKDKQHSNHSDPHLSTSLSSSTSDIPTTKTSSSAAGKTTATPPTSTSNRNTSSTRVGPPKAESNPPTHNDQGNTVPLNLPQTASCDPVYPSMYQYNNNNNHQQQQQQQQQAFDLSLPISQLSLNTASDAGSQGPSSAHYTTHTPQYDGNGNASFYDHNPTTANNNNNNSNTPTITHSKISNDGNMARLPSAGGYQQYGYNAYHYSFPQQQHPSSRAVLPSFASHQPPFPHPYTPPPYPHTNGLNGSYHPHAHASNTTQTNSSSGRLYPMNAREVSGEQNTPNHYHGNNNSNSNSHMNHVHVNGYHPYHYHHPHPHHHPQQYHLGHTNHSGSNSSFPADGRLSPNITGSASPLLPTTGPSSHVGSYDKSSHSKTTTNTSNDIIHTYPSHQQQNTGIQSFDVSLFTSSTPVDNATCGTLDEKSTGGNGNGNGQSHELLQMNNPSDVFSPSLFAPSTSQGDHNNNTNPGNVTTILTSHGSGDSNTSTNHHQQQQQQQSSVNPNLSKTAAHTQCLLENI